MPHKNKDDLRRKKGKDKMIERKKRNGKFSSKHVRIIDSTKKNYLFKNNYLNK